MSLSDLILDARFIQAGVFVLGGLYYLVTLFYHPPAVSQEERRGFTVAGAFLWLCFGIDALVSSIVGGPVNYLAEGGAAWPIYIILASRAGSVFFALRYWHASWRSFRRSSS